MFVKTAPASGTIVQDIDTRKNANGNQLESFGHTTTDFFTMQIEPIGQKIVSTPQSPPKRSPHPRKEVVESLERSLAEHGEIWAELAKV